MLSVEEIKALLQATIDHSGEKIAEATEGLAEARQNVDFFPIIFEICKNTNGTIQKAAVIQLQTYLKETENAECLSIDDFIDFYSNSNFEIQYLLQNIAEIISEFYYENENLVEFSTKITDCISNEVAAGFCLLNSIFEILDTTSSIYDYFIPTIELSLEFIKTNFEQNILDKQFQQIVNFVYSSALSVYTGCSFDDFSSELISEFLTLGITILSSQIKDQSDMYLSILLYIEQIIDTTENYEPVEQYSELPEAITTFLSGTAQDNARAVAYNILGFFLSRDQLYSIIEDSVVDLLAGYFLPIFVTDINFDEDPHFEIDRVFPSLSDNLSPISAAAYALYNGASKIASTCLEIAYEKAKEIDSDTPASYIYSILFFAGCVANSASEADIEYFSVLATDAIQNEECYIVAGCAFLARIPKIEGTDELIIPLLEMLLNYSNEEARNDIVRYMTAVASIHLISLSESKESIAEELDDSLEAITQILFELGQEYPTEEMAIAISDFSSSFAGSFINYAKEYASNLVEMMSHYMRYESAEASRNTWHFPAAIDAVIKSTVEHPEVCAELIELLMETVDQLLEEIGSSNYEELLELMHTAIVYAPDGLECIAVVPSMMHRIAMAEPMVIDVLAPLFRAVAICHPEIAADDVESFMGTLMAILDPDAGAALSEPESLRMMLQALFIVLKDTDFAQEAVEEVIEPIFAAGCPRDSIAALIACNPDAAFSNVDVIEPWLNESNPAAFLASAAVIIGRFSEFEADLGEREEEFWELVRSSLEVLRKVKIEEIDILKTPDIEDDKEDYAIFNVPELIANPVFQKHR